MFALQSLQKDKGILDFGVVADSDSVHFYRLVVKMVDRLFVSLLREFLCMVGIVQDSKGADLHAVIFFLLGALRRGVRMARPVISRDYLCFDRVFLGYETLLFPRGRVS